MIIDLYNLMIDLYDESIGVHLGHGDKGRQGGGAPGQGFHRLAGRPAGHSSAACHIPNHHILLRLLASRQEPSAISRKAESLQSIQSFRCNLDMKVEFQLQLPCNTAMTFS